jgi:hypothetical protein
MATSDEPADETNLGTLNAALQAWRGKTLTVFDVARLLGDAFGVRDAMRELLDACGQRRAADGDAGPEPRVDARGKDCDGGGDDGGRRRRTRGRRRRRTTTTPPPPTARGGPTATTTTNTAQTLTVTTRTTGTTPTARFPRTTNSTRTSSRGCIKTSASA